MVFGVFLRSKCYFQGIFQLSSCENTRTTMAIIRYNANFNALVIAKSLRSTLNRWSCGLEFNYIGILGHICMCYLPSPMVFLSESASPIKPTLLTDHLITGYPLRSELAQEKWFKVKPSIPISLFWLGWMDVSSTCWMS